MSNVNTPERSTYKRQIEIAVAALERNPNLRNKELNESIRHGLLALGLDAPQFVSNSVLTRARNQLGIKSTRGRRPGSKNRPKTPPPTQGTGISTGYETIQIGRPSTEPTLDEILAPICRMMRERGISSISLWNEGLKVTRTVSEDLVF